MVQVFIPPAGFCRKDSHLFDMLQCLPCLIHYHFWILHSRSYLGLQQQQTCLKLVFCSPLRKLNQPSWKNMPMWPPFALSSEDLSLLLIQRWRDSSLSQTVFSWNQGEFANIQVRQEQGINSGFKQGATWKHWK